MLDQLQPTTGAQQSGAGSGNKGSGAAAKSGAPGALQGKGYQQQALMLKPKPGGGGLSAQQVQQAIAYYKEQPALYPTGVVVAIQKKVGAAPDGIVGPETVKKVASWQAGHELTADGMAGPKTCTAMFGYDIRKGGPPTAAPKPTPKPSGLSAAALDKALDFYASHKSQYPKSVAIQIQNKVGATADGVIGPKTVKAIAAWQGSHGLTVDGIAGAKTLTAMFGKDIRPGTGSQPPGPGPAPVPGGTLIRPNGYNQIVQVFGQPGSNITSVAMRAGAGGKFLNVPCNAKLGPVLKAVFDDIWAAGQSGHIHTYDGCYVYRKKRGGSTWSTHAWGIAIDLNASANPMVPKSKMKISASQKVLAPYFEKRNFYWGAAFGDPMHFQYCTGY